MKVRIRKDWEEETGWIVEVKYWYNFGWVAIKYVLGNEAEQRAIKYAKNFLSPLVIEFTKDTNK